MGVSIGREPAVERTIRTMDDVMALLDALFAPEADRWTAEASRWWDAFYADRSRPVPFFVDKPDESLVSYCDSGQIRPGRALDLGCGPGRNAIFLAAQGFEVDAVDLSPTAIAWARERARAADVDISLYCADAFTLDALTGPYQLIYDSGCFHHLPPHRRISYLALLERTLAPGGLFGLSCFAVGSMGSDLSDVDLYRQGRLHGGVAYTPDSLRWIFSELTEVALRRMNDESPDSPRFGEPFLWAGLFRRGPAIGTE
jgi:SAM-dependent methyltransferase